LKILPVDAPGIGQEVMQRLAKQLGGIGVASARLGVRTTLMRRFIEGAVPVPDHVLLKAVDLLSSSIAAEPPPALLPQSAKPKGPPVI
jgi:hypothetical protein